MSRAINVDENVAAVTRICEQHNALFSVVEPLQSGGTRLVLRNSADVARITKAFGAKVIRKAVVRVPSRLMHG